MLVIFCWHTNVNAQIVKKRALLDSLATTSNTVAVLDIDSLAATVIADSLALYTDSLQVETLADSLVLASDTLQLTKADSTRAAIDSLDIKVAQNTMSEVVNYKAEDSIIYDVTNGKIYLYNKASVDNGNINLKAGTIVFDQTDKTVRAQAIPDSTGTLTQIPVFEEGGRNFETESLTYNFETEKGKLTQLVTQEGDGYLRARAVKKNEYDEMFGKDAYYTTCNLDHPHFKIEVDKVKIIPNKMIISGPAQLILEDVPTPLFLPFGYFPIQKGQASGVILPNYGYTPTRGFSLINGGYYFGISDYFDLSVTGDIFTSGDWRLGTFMRYKKKYRYNGNIRLNYGITKTGERVTYDYAAQRNFSINWTHSQDNKARPNSGFSANVNFRNSAFNQIYEVDNNQVLQNQLNSSISYRHDLPRTPFTFSANVRLDQNTATERVNMTLPNFTLTMRRIFPFKRQIQTGGAKWYEQIGVNYSVRGEVRVNTTDSLLFTSQMLDDIRYGLEHKASVSTNFKLFKYVNVSPSINYTEGWYPNSIRKEWIDSTFVPFINDKGEESIDTIPPTIQTNTINGFARASQFTSSLNATTRMFGILQFKKGKIKAIRHEITPSIGVSYRPDFGENPWDYTRFVQSNANGDSTTYNIFENALYSRPPNGEVASVNFSLGNNLQLKVLAPKDTVTGDKKIKILDRLNFSTSYNFLAIDSLFLNPISFTGGTSIAGQKIKINFNGSFDPYIIDENGRNEPIYEWAENRRPFRFETFNVGFTSSLSSEEVSNLLSNTDEGSRQEREEVEDNPQQFVNFNIPWKLSASYNLRLNKTRRAGVDTLLVTQTLNFNGSINLSSKWRIGLNSGYDFRNRALARTQVDVYRDLHCWEMNFTIVPFGQFQSYVFTIRVKSALLQDLKLNRRRSWLDIDN